MQKPVHKKVNQDTVTYFFEDETHREYYVRGALCWPVLFSNQGVPDVMGYAMVAGMDVETKHITVFEQREFIVVSSIIDENMKITHHGIGPWLIDMYSRYRCNRYYYSQPFEQTKKYRLEILRTVDIVPKPIYNEVPWPENPMEVLQTVWRAVKVKGFTAEKGSLIRRQIGEIGVEEKSTLKYPAFHAFACLLMGYERYPYQKREAA